MLSPQPPHSQSRGRSLGRAARLQPQVDSSPSRHARLMAFTTPAALTAYVKAVSRLPVGGTRGSAGACPRPRSERPGAGGAPAPAPPPGPRPPRQGEPGEPPPHAAAASDASGAPLTSLLSHGGARRRSSTDRSGFPYSS